MRSLVRKTILAATLAYGMGCASYAMAGPAQDALSACLVKSTTPADHIVLVDWIFGLISVHPSVENMASITPAQREKINRETGALYTRLLATDCGVELKEAVQKEGTSSVEGAFSTLGQLAMADVMSDPKVKAEAETFTTYLDQTKIAAALTDKPAK